MNQNEDKNSIIRSLAYKFIERCGYQGIAFIIQLVLARLLDPSDYGILTMLTIFINVSQVFVQSGLNTALIQRKDVTEKDYSTVFYMSISMAFVLYLILFFSAPFVSVFYRMPELKIVLRVLALILIPGAFNSIQNAKIAREMQFKKLMYCTFGSVIISGLTGIIMAYNGFGVWALVGQQLANQISICILMLIVVKWRPIAVFESNRLKLLFSFGWKLLCSNLIETIYRELQSLVIGKKYNSSTLGYYNRGKQFPEIIVSNLNGSIQSVMLPAFSKFQDDKARMKSMMRRAIVTSSYIVFPICMGLAVTADIFIPLILKEKWLPCVPYLRAYCFVFAFNPIHTANLQAINAQGRSDQFLKLEIIKKIYGIAILIITIFFFESPLAIAIGSCVNTLISCFINASPNKKLLNYSYFEQIRDILPSLAISVVMGGLVYLVGLFNFSDIITLIIQVFVGIVSYWLISEIFKIECYLYLKNTILGYFRKRKGAVNQQG